MDPITVAQHNSTSHQHGVPRRAGVEGTHLITPEHHTIAMSVPQRVSGAIARPGWALLKTLLLSFLLLLSLPSSAQQIKLGLLVYSGGGDWYANPTSLKNLAQFCNDNLHTHLAPGEGQVAAGSPEIFNYPFIHMTGHGRWDVTNEEAQNLRTYLEGGGFLHIDDNYGLDPYVRPALKKIFPELTLVEIPFSHPIYHQRYNFPNGLPKIHEHDEKPAKGYGLIYKGRLVCFYSYECDLGDGWEDYDVHKDPPEKHQAALQMGANLIQYVFTNR